jgi:hypothetical protein
LEPTLPIRIDPDDIDSETDEELKTLIAEATKQGKVRMPDLIQQGFRNALSVKNTVEDVQTEDQEIPFVPLRTDINLANLQGYIISVVSTFLVVLHLFLPMHHFFFLRITLPSLMLSCLPVILSLFHHFSPQRLINSCSDVDINKQHLLHSLKDLDAINNKEIRENIEAALKKLRESDEGKRFITVWKV